MVPLSTHNRLSVGRDEEILQSKDLDFNTPYLETLKHNYQLKNMQ
jgi:hypothetical protein